MIAIAVSVIAIGIYLIGLGVWILFNLPEPKSRMDESGHRYKVQECTITRCVEV